MSESLDPFAPPTAEPQDPRAWQDADTGASFLPPRRAVVAALWVFSVVCVLKMLGLANQIRVIGDRSVTFEELVMSDNITGPLDGVYLVVLLVTLVLWGMWAHRAASNLRAIRPGWGYEFTPSAHVWWYFVPFANLVKPYHAMRELVFATLGSLDPGPRTQTLGAWWGAWVTGNILGNVANRLMPDSTRVTGEAYFDRLTWASLADMASSAALVVAALVAVRIIRDVNAHQVMRRTREVL